MCSSDGRKQTTNTMKMCSNQKNSVRSIDSERNGAVVSQGCLNSFSLRIKRQKSCRMTALLSAKAVLFARNFGNKCKTTAVNVYYPATGRSIASICWGFSKFSKQSHFAYTHTNTRTRKCSFCASVCVR